MKDEYTASPAQMLKTASVLYLDGKDSGKIKEYLTSGHFLWKSIRVSENDERIVVLNAGRATIESMAKRNSIVRFAYHIISENLLADSLTILDAKEFLSEILSDCDAQIKEIIRKRVSDEETAGRYLRESLAGGMDAYYKRMMLYGTENL